MLLKSSTTKYLLIISLLSRLILLILQYIGNQLLTNHLADAYTNKFYKSLQLNKTLLIDSPFHHYTLQALEGFTTWDAQYHLEISINGYESEQHLAFLPMLPSLIGGCRKLIYKLVESQSLDAEATNSHLDDVKNYVESVAICVALNNLFFFPIATLALYSLTRSVKGNERYAKRVACWFCFNPASVFFSTCYTESLFASLAFLGMNILEYGKSLPRRHHVLDKKTETLATTNLLAITLFSLASLTRSNGTLLVGYIGYQLLLKHSTFLKQIFYCSSIQSIEGYIPFAHDIIRAFVSVLVVLSGYFLFQAYAFLRFCSVLESGLNQALPEWCNQTIPHSYPAIQSKYWNVGLLQYYQLKQIPNFLLALPVICITLFGVQDLVIGIRCRKQSVERELPYHIHALLLTIFCGLVVNIQVTTRLLLSSCPPIYWYCENLSSKTLSRRRLIMTYFITFFVLGTLLHTNFYPWT